MDTENIKDIIKKYLEFIGIKGYEAKAYLTLLRVGEETAPKLAAKSGIPLPRIYDVLESLSRKGLVEVKAGRPRLYRALPPSLALNRYVKTYIEQILEVNRKIISELEKMYNTKESREPYIWLSHSYEASIERSREWIKKMKIDGYASLNNALLEDLLGSIVKKLGENKESLFSLTLLRKPNRKIMEKLGRIDNLMVLYQPTGFINMYEQDLRRAIIYSDNYTLFTKEYELLLILNDTYYFGYWKNAHVLKRFSIVENKMYKTTHHWMVFPLIEDALSSGLNVEAYITGYWVKTKKPAEVRGYVEKTYRSPDDRERTIIIETQQGEKITVGGIGASKEDVEARYMEIKIL